MSKPRGTPVKPSAFKSTEAASSTKKPSFEKRKAEDQSEDHDVVGEDPSKTKTDHDGENVEYYQNSEESQDGEEDEEQDDLLEIEDGSPPPQANAKDEKQEN